MQNYIIKEKHLLYAYNLYLNTKKQQNIIINLPIYYNPYIFYFQKMLSPRSNYITLLKSKKDTNKSTDKTRQVYMNHYGHANHNPLGGLQSGPNRNSNSYGMGVNGGGSGIGYWCHNDQIYQCRSGRGEDGRVKRTGRSAVGAMSGTINYNFTHKLKQRDKISVKNSSRPENKQNISKNQRLSGLSKTDKSYLQNSERSIKNLKNINKAIDGLYIQDNKALKNSRSINRLGNSNRTRNSQNKLQNNNNLYVNLRTYENKQNINPKNVRQIYQSIQTQRRLSKNKQKSKSKDIHSIDPKYSLDLPQQNKQKQQELYEQQSRKNKQGQNCRIVLKQSHQSPTLPSSLSTRPKIPQRQHFLKVTHTSDIRKHLFHSHPSIHNFLTIPRQISMEYLLTCEGIPGAFLNGQTLYFKPQFWEGRGEGRGDGQTRGWGDGDSVMLRDFQIVKQIGSGGFSKVYLCRSRLDNKFYAMKLIDKQMIIKNQKKGIIMNQRNIMVDAKHPFVIQLISAFQSDKYVVFILEYCPGGQLFGLIKKYGRLSQDVIKFYIIQVLLGLGYLHSQKVVYRDIKPQNILIGIDGHIKIADLGLAKPNMQSGRLAHSFCGSPQYMSPQMILQIGHTYPVDFYCVGALMYELLTGLPPFYSQDPNQIYECVLQQEVQFPLQLENQISSQCKNLIRALLCKDPKQRLGSLYGSKQILAHPWFGKNNYQKYIDKQIKPPHTFDTLQKISLDTNMNAKNQETYEKVLRDQKAEGKDKDNKKILKDFYYNSIPWPKISQSSLKVVHNYSKSAVTPPEIDQANQQCCKTDRQKRRNKQNAYQVLSQAKQKLNKKELKLLDFCRKNQATEQSQGSRLTNQRSKDLSQISCNRDRRKPAKNNSNQKQAHKNMSRSKKQDNSSRKFTQKVSIQNLYINLKSEGPNTQTDSKKDCSYDDSSKPSAKEKSSSRYKDKRNSNGNGYVNRGFGLPYQCSLQNFFKK